MRYLSLVLVLAVASCGRPPTGPQSSPPSQQRDARLTAEEAVQLAREHCKGKASIPEDVKPLVQKGEASIVVTFPTNLPEGTLGADYHAQITIDKKTRKITKFMVGS